MVADADVEEGSITLDQVYGPCPCGECSSLEYPTYGAKAVKMVGKALKQAKAFFLKTKEVTYFVDGGANAWVKGPDGRYTERAGRFSEVSKLKAEPPRPTKKKK